MESAPGILHRKFWLLLLAFSSVASRHAGRAAGLIYLEAAYSYAFDNGKRTNVMAAQALSAPQPPPPSPTDLASFSALGNYYERANGFRFSEAELRQQRQPTLDGAVGNYRNVPGGALLMSLMMHPKKYRDIPLPSLVVLRTRIVWEPGLTTIPIHQCGTLPKLTPPLWDL